MITTPTLEELTVEALRFRSLLDLCDKNNTHLVTDDFPINNCKLSSMLFVYHVLTIWPDLKVSGISGMAKNQKGEEDISHYWLEIGEVAIDLTADQYNLIDSHFLNKEIISKRPYNSVYIDNIHTAFQYELFRIAYRDHFIAGLPYLGEDFIDDMRVAYSQIMVKKEGKVI